MYNYYRFNIERSFVVLLKEFIGRVERDTEEKYGIFQLLDNSDTMS